MLNDKRMSETLELKKNRQSAKDKFRAEGESRSERTGAAEKMDGRAAL